MPFRTQHGSHYHMTYGCHGATISCDTAGLEPCSDCCGTDSQPASPASSSTGASRHASALVGGSPTSASSDAPDPQVATGDGGATGDDATISPADAATLTDAGVDAMANGQGMPGDGDDTDWDAVFAAAFSAPSPSPGKVMTPAERIDGLRDFFPDGSHDESLALLADMARGDVPRKTDEVARAVSDGTRIAAELTEMAKAETDDERRRTLLLAMGSVAHDAVLMGTLKAASDVPAGWHVTHSLAAACNRHDMFYITQALGSKSPRQRMTAEDYEQAVLPLLETLSEFADTGFRRFPRVVSAPRRFPDGPDGERAWGTQTSVLLTKDDVDDRKVLALMDRDDVTGRSQTETYHRGAPGYWRLGEDPDAMRAKEARAIDVMARAGRWPELRKRLAIRDFDRNMLPILRWLADEERIKRLLGSGDVEASRLL